MGDVSPTEAPTVRPVRHGGAAARTTPVRTVPRWWRDASITVFWGVLLFVSALWVARGGIQGFGSLHGGLDSTGRFAGLVASALLLVQVFLMARIPWFEQAWGQDQLARTHRRLMARSHPTYRLRRHP